jgi:ATP-dependent RNA helicase RhlE
MVYDIGHALRVEDDTVVGGACSEQSPTRTRPSPGSHHGVAASGRRTPPAKTPPSGRRINRRLFYASSLLDVIQRHRRRIFACGVWRGKESIRLTQFTDLGLAEQILRALTTEGYTEPTPIQAQVIPAMIDGRDVIGIAQTGTGKTAAFVLPILHRVVGGARPKPKSCRALILTPTRELAGQIGVAIRTYGRHIRPAVATIVGGAKAGPQIRSVAPGVDVIVATPGRLMDHMSTGAVRVDEADIVILDEADQMLDLGFMPAIRQILSQCAKNRQTVLMSATMPKAIRDLAKEFQTNPLEIAVSAESKPIERIEQRVHHMDHAAKRDALTNIIIDDKIERAIVFTRTKRGADRVCKWLEDAGIKAGAIHGNKSQSQRDRMLSQFRHGRVDILVATDVAARGIDIDGVTHVINYELPDVAEAYVHRIGRTARAGASGIAISLCCADERGTLRQIEKLTGSPIAVIGAAPPPMSGSDGAARKRGRMGGAGAGRPGAARPQGRSNSNAGYGESRFEGRGNGGAGERAGGGGFGKGRAQTEGAARPRREDSGAPRGKPRGPGAGGKPPRRNGGEGSGAGLSRVLGGK